MCPRDAISITEKTIDYRSHRSGPEKPEKILLIRHAAERSSFQEWEMQETFQLSMTAFCLMLPGYKPEHRPLREPMELRTYIGKKPKQLKFRKTESGDIELDTKLAPNLKLILL
jgi:hypothetical protein